MNKIVVITGTPGAGKTTVLNEALKQTEKVKVVNYADVMLSVGKSLGLGDDHDSLRKQPLSIQKDLQKKAAEQIAKEAVNITIVDTHSTVKTKNGYLPGIPEYVVKALSPVTIILVEADPKEILERRKKDKTRSRDVEKIVGIELHQQINRAAAMASASLCGASVKIIKNYNNRLEEAASELLELLNTLKEVE